MVAGAADLEGRVALDDPGAVLELPVLPSGFEVAVGREQVVGDVLPWSERLDGGHVGTTTGDVGRGGGRGGGEQGGGRERGGGSGQHGTTAACEMHGDSLQG